MIIKSLLNLVFSFIRLIIGLISHVNLPDITIPQEFINFLQTGLYITGVTPFKLILGSVLLWYGSILGWSIIEWVYKKIPGVS